MSSTQRSVGAALMLLTALGMSRFGIVALVASGYGAMAYVFLALLAVPLLTVGVVKIARAT